MENLFKFGVYTQNAQALQGKIVNGIDPDDLDPECADYSIFEGTRDELLALAASYEAMGYKNVGGYASNWFRVAKTIKDRVD